MSLYNNVVLLFKLNILVSYNSWCEIQLIFNNTIVSRVSILPSVMSNCTNHYIYCNIGYHLINTLIWNSRSCKMNALLTLNSTKLKTSFFSKLDTITKSHISKLNTTTPNLSLSQKKIYTIAIQYKKPTANIAIRYGTVLMASFSFS